MKYGRATTDLHAKSNMHHQTNIAIQTNVCTSYSDTEPKQKYNWWPEVVRNIFKREVKPRGYKTSNLSKAHETRDSLSSFLQVVLIYFQPFRRNSLLWSVRRSRKSQKNTKTFYFGDSRSFKVIDVDTTKKPATSAYYDEQHICAYLQPFYSRRGSSGKITTI